MTPSAQPGRPTVGRRRRAVPSLVLGIVAAVAIGVSNGLPARLVRSVAGGDPSTVLDGPLPACGVDERPAPRSGPSDWARTLLDPTFSLSRADRPADLVPTSEAGLPGGEVRLLVIDDLRAMARAAARDGVRLSIRSAYRSYDDQARTVASLEREHGAEWTRLSAAQPGHSEHQLGTALDLDGGDAWLATHAWEHGFVVSYPPAWSPGETCYKPEPWHIRYLGTTDAAAVHGSGQSLRAWLWARAVDGD